MIHSWRVTLLLVVHTLERFGFWGLRSLLVLFLIEPFANGGLGWEEGAAVAWYSSYSAALYVTPAFGGWLADYRLGPRRAVILGAGLMALGILTLTMRWEPLLYLSLFLLAMGNGLLKPCLTALLGQLYEPNDKRRDIGYQYLYQTVLIGVLGSGLVCGWVQPHYGFAPAFAVAGLATALAMLLFWLVPGKKWPAEPAAKEEKEALSNGTVGTLLLLAFITVLFFAAHAQGGGLMTVFIHRYTERRLLGWEIPTLWLTSLGTLFGVALTPVLARVWLRLGEREPSFMGKLTLGMGATGLSFACMMAANLQVEWQGMERASVFWLLGYHLTYIMGKLMVTPVLWSKAAQLAPQRHRNLVVGIMMGCISLGYILGGQIGHLIGQLSFLSIFALLTSACFVAMLFLAAIRHRVLAVAS